MSKSGFKILIVVAVIFLLFSAFDVSAQCAMCKAVPTSAQESGSEISGKGINKGIIYIMIVPYLLLMGFFGYFFKDKIKPFLYDMGILKANKTA